MIDVSLVEEPVSTDNFSYQIPLVPSVFLGFILKNEYDNKRLHINEKYKPKKFIKIYKINGEMKMLPLYGIYPIDFNKFRYLTDDKISEDKKILQHMLNLNEDKFDFQKFGSILSLILT